MSRAYQIHVRESLSRVIRADDEVSTRLEVLEILPQEEMAALLAEEMKREGFVQDGERLVRRQDGVTVTVDALTGEVCVRAEECAELRLTRERSAVSWEESAKESEKRARQELRKDLESEASEEQKRLQGELTKQLEDHLAGLSATLNRAINRTTAEALKQKAARIGRIKEIQEDAGDGSLTIVVEV